MRMSEGVEWAAHVCLVLHWASLEDPSPIPAGRLAESYDLPAAYLGKQIQALCRAGITESVPGRNGGVRLARAVDEISLMDVVTAIEGPDEAFQCTEIRQRGMNVDSPAGRFSRPCGIAQAMRHAEMAWRRELAATSLADIAGRTPRYVAQDVQRFFTRI